jgi:ssDNA-binding Zn-finger/Zn-ribbon topoisomerase 1
MKVLLRKGVKSRGGTMFGIFGEKCTCPGCRTDIKANKVKISTKHEIKVFSCPKCGGEFVKNKRHELFQVLDEGVILC